MVMGVQCGRTQFLTEQTKSSNKRCDTFGPQWAPGVGSGGSGPAWSLFGDVSFAHWSRINPTNNALDLVFALDLPIPTGDPAPDMSLFRLTDRPGIGMDFTSVPQGVFVNMGDTVPTFIFGRIGGGPMQVISLNN